MSLLSKVNPKATWRSVIRRGIATSVIATGLYAMVLWWNRWWDNWPIKLGICAILVMFVAGLWEWQVPDEDSEEEEAGHGDTPASQSGHA